MQAGLPVQCEYPVEADDPDSSCESRLRLLGALPELSNLTSCGADQDDGDAVKTVALAMAASTMVVVNVRLAWLSGIARAGGAIARFIE